MTAPLIYVTCARCGYDEGVGAIDDLPEGWAEENGEELCPVCIGALGRE